LHRRRHGRRPYRPLGWNNLESRLDIRHPATGDLDVRLAYDADEDEQVLGAFRSLPRGHAYYLMVADTLAEDTGTVLRWAIRTERTGALAGQ
jgi:hypothetical protein